MKYSPFPTCGRKLAGTRTYRLVRRASFASDTRKWMLLLSRGDTLSDAVQQAQRLLQLEGEPHFAEAGCPRLERVTRLPRPAALLLAFAHGYVRASQVGLVAVGRQEFQASGEFLGGTREGLLFGEQKAADTVSHPS
jgi:hypothetical protein